MIMALVLFTANSAKSVGTTKPVNIKAAQYINGENIMSNKNTELQFTELTTDDIAIQEDLYIDLLASMSRRLSIKDVTNHWAFLSYAEIYYDYAIAELQKANELFIKEFG